MSRETHSSPFVSAEGSEADRIFYHKADWPRLKEIIGEKIARFGTEVCEDSARMFRESFELDEQQEAVS
jgi:hypothetical protein